MSSKPMTEGGDYIKNTAAAYEELGRFVEAFETMVSEVRLACLSLFSTNLMQRRELEVIFHHQVMTAKPIFEIFRASIMERLASDEFRKIHEIDLEDQKAFKGVLTTIAATYEPLITKRNSLLHGTWFIGYPSAEDPNSEQFEVYKYAVGASGLTRTQLPKNVKELAELSICCDGVRTWIMVLYECFPGGGSRKVRECFMLDDETWTLLYPYTCKLPRVPK
jgi:hypothetical protein